MSQRLAGRIAVITGASRGIGRAVAIAFATEGAHVVLVARSVPMLEKVDDDVRLAGGTATLVQLDLRKGDQIDALGPSLYQRFGRLDVLVGNAGTLGTLSPLGHLQVDTWETTLAINLTANWRLIRTLDPLLRRSAAGRAIFVTSGAARAETAYWGPYAVSKAGLEALVKTYAHEVAETTVRANLISPGPVRTQMRAKAFPGEDPGSLPAPEDVAPLFVELAAEDCISNGETFEYVPPGLHA
jgi:NAD(P)-dependent dehydrogenase (short-subunit alcohol dehydrogenase family)